jgi:hypothetical protein
MSQTDLKVNGLPVGRKGGQFIANLDVNYKIDQRAAIVANGSWSYIQKDKIIGPNGVEITEPKNSNSNVLIGSIGPAYALSDRLTVGANYSVLWRLENYYDFTESQFVPAKLKQSAGGNLNYVTSPSSSIGISASYFWVRVNDGPLLPTVVGNLFGVTRPELMPPGMEFTGWTAVLTGKIRF